VQFTVEAGEIGDHIGLLEGIVFRLQELLARINSTRVETD
jgi:hypothetical protein